nr:PH domain leucine-rich repeat-containing protein phosphatase 1-like [Cherax quadricarinatus]
MEALRGHSLRSSRRGILKNIVTAEGEILRRAEVDLSGRHLERLPTALFSSLHLISINLSHNLLNPTSSTTTSKKRQVGRGRRRRDRLRRQAHPEPREPSGGGGQQQANDSLRQLGEDEVLSGDSGVPSDPIEDEVLRSEPATESGTTKSGFQTDKTAHPETKQSPVFGSLAEELEARLRFRKAITERLLVGKSEEGVPFTYKTLTIDANTPQIALKKPSLKDVVESTVRERERHKSEEGVRARHEESSSSSGVEESESGSESESVEIEGGVRTVTSRTLGALHHLKHFQQLQVVVLASNRLQEFPGCLLKLPALARLSLAHNLLHALPHALATLTRLVELDVSYNQLTGVGAGVGGLPSLAHLRLAHNRITDVPELTTMEELRTLDISGNRLRAVDGLEVQGPSIPEDDNDSLQDDQFQDDLLHEGHHDSQPLALNLSLNNLTGPVTLASIQNVTELDVSDNGISSLDVSCLAALTSLTCSNNAITAITLHAAALTSLTATNNRLTRLEVRYHPRRLTRLNLARNELSAVPPWLVSSTEVTLVDVSHNQVTCLPAFLTSGHLRRLHTLSAHHNRLTAFPVPQRGTIDLHKDSSCSYISRNPVQGPHRSSHLSSNYNSVHNLQEEPRLSSLEVLFLHHNRLTALPSNLFSWLNKLRVLNVSANHLSALPGAMECRGSRGKSQACVEDAASPKETLSLQEVYAAANRLRDLTPLQQCRALRILHAPYNRITNLQDRLVWSWELLEELVLSGNQLTVVPAGVSRLRRLRVLKVHSNPLQSLPRLAHLSALKVVDASHCQLGRIELEELVSPGLVALDISGNTALSLDHHQFTKCKSRRPVSVVDVTSRSGRSLPLTRPQANSQQSDSDQRSSDHTKDTSNLPWTLGFAEAIGRDSKLTIGQLRVPDVGGLGSVGIAAVADGGQEMGSVGSLLALLPTLLQEECACSHTRTYALKYALLTALRRLRSQGVAAPAAVCAAHLEADTTHLVLRLCCYGPVSAVVTTTHGQPIVLTTTATRKSRTVEECSEGLKCVLAEAPTLPDPHTTELHLGPHHTAVVIASTSLWDVLGPKEAVSICSEIREAGSAAKRLLDLAQAYGTRQDISVIVVRLTSPQHMTTSQSPVPDLLHMKSKSVNMNSSSVHESSVGLEREIFERDLPVTGREQTENNRRVKYERGVGTVEDHNLCIKNDQRKKSNKCTDFMVNSYHILNNEAKKSNFIQVGLQSKNQQSSDVTQRHQEMDRSSPSGQSQSDYSEHGVDIQKHVGSITNELHMHGKSKEKLWKSVEDLYAHPNRRKKEKGKKCEAGSKAVYTNDNTRRAIAYYHYPRPDPAQAPLENHLEDHFFMGLSDTHTGVLAPPAGFDDTDSDSEGSDSGLSGVSGGQHHTSLQNHTKSGDDVVDNGSEQVNEEQFRSWEYLLARNAKLLFMRELDTLKRSNSQSSPMPTASAPDLVLAASAEIEPSGYFQRNNVRKSCLGRGTFRLIQSKLSATTNKFSTLQRFRSPGSKNHSNFHRFGSLQNLKYYQENRPRPPHYPLVQPDLAAEMQERPALDSLELETRMHHYWHTGVTNF